MDRHVAPKTTEEGSDWGGVNEEKSEVEEGCESDGDARSIFDGVNGWESWEEGWLEDRLRWK